LAERESEIERESYKCWLALKFVFTKLKSINEISLQCALTAMARN